MYFGEAGFELDACGRKKFIRPPQAGHVERTLPLAAESR